MTGAELRARLAPLLGPTWQAKLARAIGVNVRSVRKWVSGKLPVPEHVEALVELLEVVAIEFEVNGVVLVPDRWKGLILRWQKPESAP